MNGCKCIWSRKLHWFMCDINCLWQHNAWMYVCVCTFNTFPTNSMSAFSTTQHLPLAVAWKMLITLLRVSRCVSQLRQAETSMRKCNDSHTHICTYIHPYIQAHILTCSLMTQFAYSFWKSCLYLFRQRKVNVKLELKLIKSEFSIKQRCNFSLIR